MEGIGEGIFTALLIILNTANPFHLHLHLPFFLSPRLPNGNLEAGVHIAGTAARTPLPCPHCHVLTGLSSLPCSDWHTSPTLLPPTSHSFLLLSSPPLPLSYSLLLSLSLIPLIPPSHPIPSLYPDVSHFVHPDTAMDKEASHRSTSTYLVGEDLEPQIPHRISHTLNMLPSLMLIHPRSYQLHIAICLHTRTLCRFLSLVA